MFEKFDEQMKWIRNLFKSLRKKCVNDSLRQKCVDAYGEEFGKMYDMVNCGEPIGNMIETIIFLEMVEAVKKGKPYEVQSNITTNK